MPSRNGARRTIVVIGASAGGVEAVRSLLQALPADFGAAIFVVVHIPSTAPSRLADVLARRTGLPVAQAVHGERIRGGRVSVAPPGRHLLVRRGFVELSTGPHENGSRPAIDPLFRTAAEAYGPSVVGVVLTGMLSDGAYGMLAIHRAGGLTLVQDPDEAMFGSMPRSVLQHVPVDHVSSIDEIGRKLVEIVGDATFDERGEDMDRRADERHDPAGPGAGVRENESLGGKLVPYTCPECHGNLWEAREGTLTRYRCRIGHAFSEEALFDQQGGELEAALWSAVVSLEEHADLSRRMAQRAAAHGHDDRARRFTNRARLLQDRARVIYDVLMHTPLDSTAAEATPADVAG